jgi:LytS/YehU family sensor histidine kinase
MTKKPVIKKIEFTKEELDVIDRIKKGEPVKRIRVANNTHGYKYEITSNKPLTSEVARKRLTELYGDMCTGCGIAWPDYKIMFNVGDQRQGAWLVQRYCSPCYDKWKDRLRI